ncbi:hypothetical protein PF005_g10459 [Phytophthora fragariae]|uniref:Uncharacterized protein n=1 Tax=Phytophthora fragariae TaxID=53985 RepID=A0A6A3E679_9STRA|nr:hypothetical protein PF003_g15068 [Phytophthora fragariae]KAE8929264.1 hypothetical protein PF009_g20607 [Phytophthora fragariae]KAE9008110.1 hypothetical protein PF011_g10834 [Phytophthora fragariae]KAE9091719.1 hypothetical protein PF010_g18092 [Phytophthora fragariae]KAE9120052.1 hypothetical protein PF006_g18224 [Phytophthora fragariae]
MGPREEQVQEAARGGIKYHPDGGVPRTPPSAPAGRKYILGSGYQAQQSWQSTGTMPPAPASRDYQKAGRANRGAPLSFSHPLYAMDAERIIRRMIHLKVTGKGLDNSGLAVHQDEINNTVVKYRYVQDSLCKELSFREIIISANSTPDVFVSRNFES